ncbi:hypothetical protein ABID22_003066 [Pontibacter aydingkolensis]
MYRFCIKHISYINPTYYLAYDILFHVYHSCLISFIQGCIVPFTIKNIVYNKFIHNEINRRIYKYEKIIYTFGKPAAVFIYNKY